MLREVRLYGEMGRRFGRVHRYDVSSPAEALRALRANCGRAFDQFLYAMREQPFRVQIGDEIADEQRMVQPVGRETIRFIPVVCGAAKSPIWGILIGAALIIFAGPIGQGLGGSLIGGATITSAALGLGWGLVLGGVAQLLFKPPMPTSQEPVNNLPSYSFSGAVNTVTQGNPVPVGYGRMIVGSQVISMGLYTDRTDGATGGSVIVLPFWSGPK